MIFNADNHRVGAGFESKLIDHFNDFDETDFRS